MAEPSPPIADDHAADRRMPLYVLLAMVVAVVVSMAIACQVGAAPQFRKPVLAVNVLAAFAGVFVPLLAWWAAAVGIGYPLRRWLLPKVEHALVIQAGVGMSAMMTLTALLAWVDALNQVTAWGLIAIGIGLLAWQIVTHLKTDSADPAAERDSTHVWLVLAAAPALAALLTAAACPPSTIWAVEGYGYDVLSYHLQLPREWTASGGWRGYTHNVYSFFPSLGETTYMHIGLMTDMQAGSIGPRAIFAANYLHVSAAIMTALAIGSIAWRLAGRAVGMLVGALFLAVPWTLILGSLAYNEMFMLAPGATALAIAADRSGRTLRGAGVAGFLVGAATLAKLTAGPHIALPIGLIYLWRLYPALREQVDITWKQAIAQAAVAGAVGTLVLVPFFVRNTVASGNPVFPFATERFGQAHWSDYNVQRWKNGHFTAKPWGKRIEAFNIHWLTNAGYGAVGGSARDRDTAGEQFETENVAHFPRQRGFPLLWLGVGFATVLMLMHRDTRFAAVGMLLMLGVQLFFWFTTTHLQSRFLVGTLLPTLVLLAGGLGRVRAMVDKQQWIAPAFAGMLVLTCTLGGYALIGNQTLRLIFLQDMIAPDGRKLQIPAVTPVGPGVFAGALDMRDSAEQGRGAILANGGDHPVNLVGPDAHILIVAGNARLLYLRRHITYSSAFDTTPLGEIVRDVGPNPDAVNAKLREMGITHVWIDEGEYARLRGSYGYDPDLTPEVMDRLKASWTREPMEDSIPVGQRPWRVPG